ncbi:hypothetical protein VCSRO11_2711 [Vibrio cholerae]|nr:hypothetical protein VCSRO11_2711 [Vibrio cholerae]GIB94606.1 hypothetical protein VCSRO190_3124 [Vibrio cholerae]
MHHTAARNGEADHAGVVRFIVGQHIAAGNGVFSYRDRIVGHIALIWGDGYADCGAVGIAIGIGRHIVKADVAVEVGIRHKGHAAVGGNLHAAVAHGDVLRAAS